MMNQNTSSLRIRPGHSNEKRVVVHLSRVLVNTVTDNSHGTGGWRNDYNGAIPLLPQLLGDDRRNLVPTNVKVPGPPLGKPMELAEVS